MEKSIELWQLQPSFNSRKIRYALGLKGASYKAINVKDGENQEVVAVSGQPLTPMLRHGDVVMFDSGAIVRYIDANIPGPRLFSPHIDEMRAIEKWETQSRQELLVPYLKIMSQVKSGNKEGEAVDAAKALYFAGAKQVQDALNEHGVLVGTALSAADIFCGCYLAYAFLSPAQAAGKPPLLWSLENLSLMRDASMTPLCTWFERLRVLDAT